MIDEDYVSYETAQALKKAGFNWDIDSYYGIMLTEEGDVLDAHLAFEHNDEYEFCDYHDRIPAPTLAQAQKWLREMKRWHIEVRINGCRNMFCVELWEMKANGGYMMLEHKDGHARLFDRYEDALSEGISETLKLIEEGEGWK